MAAGLGRPGRLQHGFAQRRSATSTPTATRGTRATCQVGGVRPYPISYRSIVPKAGRVRRTCWCRCACRPSHIAYGSIRMEPVFMVLGQSAATAAAMALDGNTDVQKVDYAALGKRLVEDGQVLEWTGPARDRAGIDPKTLPGVVVDDGDARIEGGWTSSTSLRAVRRDVATGTTATRTKARTASGSPPGCRGRDATRCGWRTRRRAIEPRPCRSPSSTPRASQRVTVNQKKPPPIDETFMSLGAFSFAADRPAAVTVSTEGTRGHVVADAVVLVPVR